MRQSILTLIFVFLSTAAIAGEDGLIRIQSSQDVESTGNKLEKVLNEKGMNVFARINHSQGAEKAGLTLKPTEVVIFGNPKVGTPLMNCGRTVAIDLPQKMLIWEDDSGDVWIAYNDPAYIAGRHNLQGCDNVLEKVTGALANFARAAATP